MFTPKGMRRQHSRLGLSRSVVTDSPKTPKRQNLVDSPKIGTPGRSNEATSVPIKVYELLKSNDKVACGILPGGVGLAITNDTIIVWKLSNTMKVYQLPIPANYACKPQNIAVIGHTVCFVSTTGTGRFWATMENATKWIEFKITLDRDDLINALHGDQNKIGAVTTRGVLFNIYVQSGVVSYNTHRLPSKSSGLVRRVSSMFWTQQAEEAEPISSKSLLVGGIFVICVNQTVYGWDLSANVTQPRLIAPYTDVFGADANLESVAGNDKYIGFLIRVKEDNQEELHRLISPIDELIVSPSGSDRAEIKLSSSVTDNERAQDLQLVLPYLAQVAVSSIKHVWLSNEKCVGEDAIQAVGAYDGQIALLTTKGLRLYKTQQRVESVQLDQVDSGQNQIEQLEQLSKSELPQDRLSAAVAQYNQGNNSEAEQLLSTIGALDQVAMSMSGDMIDEIPLHDPRWSRSKMALQAQTQTSLLIQRQLQEKQAKHRLFVNFLKDRLSDEALDSLAQDGEKIELTLKLRTAGSQLQSQLDQAIRVLIQQRKITMQLGLTHQDHFYQKVSETHQIINVISQLMENTVINSKDRVGKVSFEAIEIIQKMNSLICLIINACGEYRSKYNLIEQRRPWSTILQEPLIEILKLNGDNNIPSTIPACIDELIAIAKFVLMDRLEHHKANGESDVLSEESEFGQLRSQIINIFIDSESYGEAAVLGEQFHDFATLLKLYELDGNDAKLAEYLNLPKFAEFIYKKYRGEKLVKLAARHKGKLAELVSADPQHGWLLSVELKQLSTASEQLIGQAEIQKENSLSKRTLLSVAKLTAIASGASADELGEIKKKETLLNYQDRLPDKLLHVSCSTPALDCLDLIDAMTSGNVAQITLDNGRDALDILELVAEEEKQLMKSLIWSRLIESEITSSTWKNALGNSHQPIEALRGTKFADLLAKASEDELPIVDELKNQSELADFGDNAVFAFIIGAAIEARRGELCEMSA